MKKHRQPAVTTGIRRPYRQPSVFDQLTPKQIATLNKWLIKDVLPYSEVRVRIKDDFGFWVSLGSISRYWTRICSPQIFQDKNQLPQDSFSLEIIVRKNGTVIGTQVVNALSAPRPASLAPRPTSKSAKGKR